MAIWISSNIDIGWSLNYRDSFPRWKFKNRARTSCSPDPILWPPTISFELHAEMAEEIDIEKCTFRKFGSSVTLTLTLDRVEVTLVRICGRGLPTHQIRWKSEKLFVDGRTYGRTDTPQFQSTRSSPRRWPKNGEWWRWVLVSPDSVAPSRMVGVFASVNLPLHHKVQKFSSGTSSPRWCGKKGHKMVVVWCYYNFAQLITRPHPTTM